MYSQLCETSTMKCFAKIINGSVNSFRKTLNTPLVLALPICSNAIVSFSFLILSSPLQQLVNNSGNHWNKGKHRNEMDQSTFLATYAYTVHTLRPQIQWKKSKILVYTSKPGLLSNLLRLEHSGGLSIVINMWEVRSE